MSTPGLPRRLASMVYEAVLLFAVAFFAAWLFYFASGARDATSGWLRYALQLFIAAIFAAYFLWCWLRGGQTLAMKAWGIRLVDVTPGKALYRLLLAGLLVPTGVSILWPVFDRKRQFLHDRLAGTRLVLATQSQGFDAPAVPAHSTAQDQLLSKPQRSVIGRIVLAALWLAVISISASYVLLAIAESPARRQFVIGLFFGYGFLAAMHARKLKVGWFFVGAVGAVVVFGVLDGLIRR